MKSLLRMLGVGMLAVLLSGCWPTPGAGPDRRSFNPFEQTLTPDRVPALTEAFRVPLEGGAGPPVVTGAGLFVRSGLSIAAFEPGTGAARWTVRVPSAGAPDDFVRAGDPFVPGGERVVATATYQYSGGVLGHELVTLDAVSGAIERQPVSGAIGSLRNPEVAVQGRLGRYQELTTFFVSDLDGNFRWGGVAPEAAGGALSLDRDRLFVATGQQVQSYDTTTPCLPIAPDIGYLACASEWVRPVSGTATPVVIGDDETLFVGSSVGTVSALDATAGGVRWFTSIGAPVDQPPALADGVLYVASSDGRLSAVPADPCGYARCPVSWTTEAGAAISVQPAVAGGVVYVGAADGTLRAFDADGCGSATCPPLWTANVGSAVDGGLAVFGGKLYVGAQAALVAYGLPPG